MKYPDFKVCVRCFTFNQSEYITDAMNGFTMQQTSFPFVCTIVDDASTDGEQEVIKQYVDENFDRSEKGVSYTKETDYAHILYAQHKTNKNCYFAILFLKENHYSIKKPKLPYLKEWDDEVEFIAMCEGDDYWIDATKLQRQYSFLNNHDTHSMCFHAVRYLYNDGNICDVHKYQSNNYECNIREAIMDSSYSKLNAIMYRKSKYGNGFLEWVHNCPVGDAPMELTLFVKGKVAYINEVMSCYRCVANNSWSKRMESIKNKRQHYLGIIKMYDSFDNWTHGIYHDVIVKKKKQNKLKFYKTLFRLFKKKLKESVLALLINKNRIIL